MRGGLAIQRGSSGSSASQPVPVITPNITGPLVVYQVLSHLLSLNLISTAIQAWHILLLHFTDEETEAESDCMISRSRDY